MVRELAWRKRSFSGLNGGDCVEVAWRKSSFSMPDGGDCVEIALGPTVVGVRDSKNSDGGVLMFSATQWQAFIARQP